MSRIYNAARIVQRGSSGLGLPKALSANTIEIIKSTAPVVAPLAVEITTNFYARLFINHPELFAFFNKSNQNQQKQARALAQSIIAYATHIENLGALVGPHGPVDLIAHKHCGLNVLPGQYPVVHDNLMASIGEVLGGVVTPEIGAAWSESVLFLAKVLIDREEVLYTEAENRSGGWRNFKKFKIVAIDDIADSKKQFTFTPSDGSDGPYEFDAGQFISLKVDPNGDGLIAPRHYTVTSAPNSNELQCTIKLVEGGVVSTYFHNDVKVGDELDMSPPFGIFTPRENDDAPIVLLSSGIGITPMVNFYRHFGDRVGLIVHLEHDEASHAYKSFFDAASCPKQFIYTSAGRPSASSIVANMKESLGDKWDIANIYMCGPVRFMADIMNEVGDDVKGRLFSEKFGPELDNKEI